jgi:hypothetical protein
VKTAKYSKVFMKKVWQQWAIVATKGYSSTTHARKKFVIKKTSKSPQKVRLEMGFDGQNLSLSAELITE